MIAKYFTKSEIECHCGCGQSYIDQELLDMADKLREYIGYPMITHCTNRCTKHNRNVGGVSNSLHIGGHAMDFHCKGLSNRKLHKILKKLWKRKNILTGGLGLYKNWGAHIDTGRYRRWGE